MATNRKAKTFFETLNSANRYAILFRIQTAKKAETRARRDRTIHRDAGEAREDPSMSGHHNPLRTSSERSTASGSVQKSTTHI
jgi:hypothetical protein